MLASPIEQGNWARISLEEERREREAEAKRQSKQVRIEGGQRASGS